MKHCTLALLCTSLLGLWSCAEDEKFEDVAGEANPLVVASAKVAVEVDDDGSADTRAIYDGRKSTWAVGDQLVAFSNGQVNGTLTCTSASGTAAAFSGELKQFTPGYANFYFLGNRTISGSTATIDFSSQSGKLSDLGNHLLMKQTAVVLTDEDGDGTYVTASNLSLKPMLSVVRLNLAGAGTPAAQGYKGKQVKITGLTNQLTLDLAAGTPTAGYNVTAKADAITNVMATSASDYATEFYVAVLPHADNTNVTITAFYQSDGAGSQPVIVKGQNWSSMAPGKRYVATLSSKNPQPVTSKSGYNGGSVEGDRGDGMTTKGGYNGGNIEGDLESGASTKGGYNGGSL